MRGSKALKKTPKRLMRQECGCPEGDTHNHSKINKALRAVARFFLFNVYYPAESFFSRTVERVARSFSWARFTYLNYDFDSAYLYDVMQFKLKRLYICLEHGHAYQDPVDMKALKELIKICGRIREDEYDDKHHKNHDKKWGKSPRWSSKPSKLDENGKPITYEIIFKNRPNANTPELQKQERKEFVAIWDIAHEEYKKDIDRMAEILKQHGKNWWD